MRHFVRIIGIKPFDKRKPIIFFEAVPDVAEPGCVPLFLVSIYRRSKVDQQFRESLVLTDGKHFWRNVIGGEENDYLPTNSRVSQDDRILSNVLIAELLG